VARWAGRPAGEWPLHSFLELGALDGAVPSARLHARHVLCEWGLAASGDAVELVVSDSLNIDTSLKVRTLPQVKAMAPTLKAGSGWCLQAAPRRRQASRSVSYVRFL
jgi:hypothetical protein